MKIATQGLYIGSIPSKTATNFRYNPASRHLVFSDNVYSDGNITSVKEQDEAWENRGNSAYVYDETYVRHWDTWVGPKKPQLFSVLLQLNPDRVWKMGTEFHAPLRGTGHVRWASCDLDDRLLIEMLSTPLLSLLAEQMTLMSLQRISCTPLRTLNSLKHGTQSKMHVF